MSDVLELLAACLSVAAFPHCPGGSVVPTLHAVSFTGRWLPLQTSLRLV